MDDLFSDWRKLAILGLLIAVGAFGAALISQYFFGLQPCQLCIWQRYPYVIGIPLGLIGLVLAAPALSRLLLGLAALSFAVGVGIAVFHTGVEFGWWLGLSSCGGGVAADNDLGAFLNRMKDGRPPACDERRVFFLGLSMTNWNALVSADIAAFLGLAAWKRG
jgi:disulfide bond formation protein DsbB